ncbi:transposase [Lentzea sp. CA-135723]|uniref:transposase n=1 Tax=Lentzea sp. CA-135723 TaxID=3239950 RepID=UPI003D8AFEB0
MITKSPRTSVYRVEAAKASCGVSGRACRDRTRRYPSDLTDEQWQVLEPQALAVMAELRKSPAGAPTKHDLRAMVDAIGCLTRYGIEWRALPVDFPPVAADGADYGEPGDEIDLGGASLVGGEAVEQDVGDVLDARPHPGDRTAGEGPVDELAKPGVIRRVHVQQVRRQVGVERRELGTAARADLVLGEHRRTELDVLDQRRIAERRLGLGVAGHQPGLDARRQDYVVHRRVAERAVHLVRIPEEVLGQRDWFEAVAGGTRHFRVLCGGVPTVCGR